MTTDIKWKDIKAHIEACVGNLNDEDWARIRYDIKRLSRAEKALMELDSLDRFTDEYIEELIEVQNVSIESYSDEYLDEMKEKQRGELM